MLENDLDLGLIFNEQRLISPSLTSGLTSSKRFLKRRSSLPGDPDSFCPPPIRRGSLLLNARLLVAGAFARAPLRCLLQNRGVTATPVPELPAAVVLQARGVRKASCVSWVIAA